MTTSIIINVTEAGTNKKRKRSVTNINPKATNEQLKTFAQQMVQLTTSNYVDTDRVDKINVDTEETKQYRDITVENAERNQTATMEINVQANGSVNPAIFFYANGSVQNIDATATGYTSEEKTRQRFTFQIPNNSGSIFIGSIENALFYSTFNKIDVN